MKIAIISMIREPWGGSEELWYEMAKQAIAEGHEIIHLSYDFGFEHPNYRKLLGMGARLYQRPGYFRPGIRPQERTLRLAVNFVRKKLLNQFSPIFREQPDVVLYNGTCYSIAKEKGLTEALESSSARLYLIGHLNSESDRGFQETERDIIIRAYRRATAVLFISERSCETAERQLCTSIPNAAIVRNPVNLRDTGRLAFPAMERVQMATVGNLVVSHKGQDVLLDVLRSPKWRSRQWTLNIYGQGPDSGYLKELVQFYQLGDRVLLFGQVNDIRQLWRDNHLLLMPSHMEGMPLAIVEAMLCGRPCVATDVGGVAEWIEDGQSGFIAASSTVHALDGTLERAWEKKDQWEEIGVRAHGRAMQLYDPQAGKTLLDRITKS